MLTWLGADLNVLWTQVCAYPIALPSPTPEPAGFLQERLPPKARLRLSLDGQVWWVQG